MSQSDPYIDDGHLREYGKEVEIDKNLCFDGKNSDKPRVSYDNAYEKSNPFYGKVNF